jgi:NAD(P) transhydrogenase subunit alpha
MQDVQGIAEKARAAAEAARRAAEEAAAAADAARTYAEKAMAKGGAAADAAGAALAHGAADPFIYLFAIFVLAVFVGYYVVWSVTPALHTPLMSVTNAISSVIVVGALLAVGAGALYSGTAVTFGFIALILASVNIFGGFLVTQRMLAMFRKKN